MPVEFIEVQLDGLRSRSGPMTWGQSSIGQILLRREESSGEPYNLCAEVILSNGVNVQNAVEAFAEILRRHEALRTRFDTDRGRQVVDGSGTLQVKCVHVVDSESVTLAAATAQSEISASRFDTSLQWPIKVTWIIYGEAIKAIVFGITHAAVDGAAIAQLKSEILILVNGKPISDYAALQPIDLANLEQRQAESTYKDRFSRYIKRQFDGLSEGFLAQRAESYETPRTWETGTFSTVFSRGSQNTARRLGVSESSVFLSAAAALLSRHSGMSKVLLQVLVANRFTESTQGLVSNIAQPIPVLLDAGFQSFDALVKETYGKLLTAYRYAHYDPEWLTSAIRDAPNNIDPSICHFNYIGNSEQYRTNAGGSPYLFTKHGSPLFWLNKVEASHERFYVNVRATRGHPVTVKVLADTHYVKAEEISRFLIDMEELVGNSSAGDFDIQAAIY